MKKVVHFEVHFVILYSKTELLTRKRVTLNSNQQIRIMSVLLAHLFQ